MTEAAAAESDILLVEDEQALCDNLVAYFADEGMVVVAVPSGEAALDRLRDGYRPRVCILDMRLPGMDGNETALALHRLDPGLRFVIHTGSTAYRLPKALRELGISDHQVFAKPVADMGTLVDAVRALAAEAGTHG